MWRAVCNSWWSSDQNLTFNYLEMTVVERLLIHNYISSYEARIIIIRWIETETPAEFDYLKKKPYKSLELYISISKCQQKWTSIDYLFPKWLWVIFTLHFHFVRKWLKWHQRLSTVMAEAKTLRALNFLLCRFSMIWCDRSTEKRRWKRRKQKRSRVAHCSKMRSHSSFRPGEWVFIPDMCRAPAAC